MARYPMTDIIARREYDFVGPAGQTKVVATLGKPAIMPDAPNRDWYCPWLIEGADRRYELYGGGVDSLQALLMGISGLRIDLQDIGRRGKLTFLGGDDLSIELAGRAA